MKTSKFSLGSLANRLLGPVRRQASGEEGVALLSAIFFMVALTGTTALLLGVILGQINPSFSAQKSTKTVNAAQAGLQAGLGILRAATTGPDITGVSYGSTKMLPCAFTGNVDGSTNAVSYSVTIQYFTTDPTGFTKAQLDAQDLVCAYNGSTTIKDSSGNDVQPTFAVVTSKGQGTANSGSSTNDGSRSVAAVYQFRVSNVNIPGGRIWNTASKTYCAQASSAAANSTVVWTAAANCTSANDATQLWIYDTDYEIKLAGTTVAGATPLCITGPVDASGNAPSPLPATADARLTKCLTTAARWSQLWSWGGNSNWVGQQNPYTAGYSSYCIQYGSVAEANRLTVSNASCDKTFSPDFALGAGAASKATNQLVNYREFGRCADVTGENISASFEIVYPCKQDPSGPLQTQLKWNHKWFYSEPLTGTTSITQQIYVMYLNTTKYCLQTPTLASGSLYPVFTVSCSNGEALQKWTRYQETGDSRTSYTVQDSLGRCLTSASNDLYGTGTTTYSKMTVEPCSGALKQKWNAPAAYSDATFGSYREIAG